MKNLKSVEWKSLDLVFCLLNDSLFSEMKSFFFSIRMLKGSSVFRSVKNEANEWNWCVMLCAILCMTVWVFLCPIDNWKEFTDTCVWPAIVYAIKMVYFVSSVIFHSKILFILPGYCSFMKWFIRGTNVYIHWLSIVFCEIIQLKTRALN